MLVMSSMPSNRPIPDPKPPAKSSGGLQSLVQAEKLMQIALLLPCSVFVGWLLGAWADGHFHQTWIEIIGMIFGGISGLVYVIRLVTSAGADSGKDDGGGTNSGKGNTDAGR